MRLPIGGRDFGSSASPFRSVARCIGTSLEPGREMNRNQVIQPQREGAEPKTVLIVEDNELNMKLFHDLLEAHGYQTVGSRNGIEALDLARKNSPDLILMET